MAVYRQIDLHFIAVAVTGTLHWWSFSSSVLEHVLLGSLYFSVGCPFSVQRISVSSVWLYDETCLSPLFAAVTAMNYLWFLPFLESCDDHTSCANSFVMNIHPSGDYVTSRTNCCPEPTCLGCWKDSVRPPVSHRGVQTFFPLRLTSLWEFV